MGQLAICFDNRAADITWHGITAKYLNSSSLVKLISKIVKMNANQYIFSINHMYMLSDGCIPLSVIT